MDDGLSSVTFGGFPNDYIEAGAEKVKLDLVEKYNMWWTVNMTKIQYGSESIYTGDKYAILDTGTSLITLMLSDYLEFVKRF